MGAEASALAEGQAPPAEGGEVPEGQAPGEPAGDAGFAPDGAQGGELHVHTGRVDSGDLSQYEQQALNGSGYQEQGYGAGVSPMAASPFGGTSAGPAGGEVPNTPAAWDAMEASMMALQSALMVEEDARKKLMPVPNGPETALGGAMQNTMPDESMEARLAQLSAAIEGDDAISALLAAEDAARNEARARRIKEREAKREQKRKEKAGKDATVGGAAGMTSSLQPVLPVMPVVVEKRTIQTTAGAEIAVSMQLAPSVAAKVTAELSEQQAEERERQRLKEEWEERERRAAEAETKRRANQEEAELRRQAEEEKRASRKLQEAAAEAAQIAERERTEAGSAQNIARAMDRGETLKQLSAAASRAADSERLITMIQDNAPDLVCDCMAKYPNDVDIQDAGCLALKSLALGEDRMKMRNFCERGMDCVCAALEVHGGVASFQISAFAALANLAVHITNKVAVVHVVLAGLSADPGNVNLAEVACCAIKNAALGDDSNRVAATEAGAIDALLDAMRGHALSAPVQEQACWAIKNLAVNATNQERLAEMGAIQDVLGAMRALPRHAAVQEQACWALRILAFRQENNQMVADEGGVQAVIDAMKMHVSNAGVQETCCGALRTLGVIPDSKIEVVEKGAFVRVVAAMRAHSKRSSVQIATTGLLSSLVSNPDTQRRAANAGVIEAIVEVLQVHRKNPKVQQACFTVLSNLTAANAENKSRAANAGAVQAAVNGLHTHANLTPLCEVCCDTLASIVSNEASQRVALDAKGIEAIVHACRAHPHRPNLQEKGCKAMSSITWCQPPAQRRAREAGVLKDIMTMMNMHPDSRGVQKQARALMQTIQVEEAEDEDDFRPSTGRDGAVVGLTIRQPNYRYHTL